MSWLTEAAREKKVVQPTDDFKPNKCFHCEVPVKWKPEDKRASDEGSFVAEDNSFTCPNGYLHQG